MSAGRPARTSTGWLGLLALPVLCCVGHVVLLALGAGSLTAVVAGVAGSAVLAGAGLLLVVSAVALRLRRRL